MKIILNRGVYELVVTFGEENIWGDNFYVKNKPIVALQINYYENKLLSKIERYQLNLNTLSFSHKVYYPNRE